jgi:inosose dehydratase
MTTGLRFGCEVYTWHMAGQSGRLAHMIEVAATVGFRGIEPVFAWMGELADPQLLRAHLTRHRIELAAVVLALPWNDAHETDSELDQASAAISLLTQFPGALLCLVQVPSGRHALPQRYDHLLRHLHAVADRARAHGIRATFHPNSPPDSITRSAADYAYLLPRIDPLRLGWTPDVGHLIHGGMDPLTEMQRHARLINHVHFKDWDGRPEFALMGTGKVDFVAITRWLQAQAYNGWIICEDEGPAACTDPDGVTRHDGTWITTQLLPALAGSRVAR